MKIEQILKNSSMAYHSHIIIVGVSPVTHVKI